MLVSLDVQLQARPFRTLRKPDRDVVFLPGAPAHVRGQLAPPVPDVDPSLVVRLRVSPRHYRQVVGNIPRNAIDEGWDTGVALIDIWKIPRFDKRVDAVNVKAIQKREALLAIVVLVLEEGDRVAGAIAVEVVQEPPVQMVSHRVEQRVVQHDDLKVALVQTVREA